MNFQSVLQFTLLFVTLFACFVHAATIEHNLVGDNATKERTLRFSLDNLKFTWSGGANYEMVVISEETFNKEGSNVNCALLNNHSLLGFEDSYVSGDIVEFAQPGIYYFRLRSKTSEECYSGSSPDPRLKVIIATKEPTNTPTNSPTRFPTASPTAFPTTSPTSSPTSPTPTPTSSPVAPTHTPTSSPTAPTHSPSASPTAPTGSPTVSPTAPTGSPTSSPTSSSTVEVTNKNNTVSESFPTVGVALGSITAVVLFAGIVVATVAAKKNDQSPDTVSSLACACCVREKRSRRHTDPAEVAQRKTKAVTRKKKKKYKIRFGKKKQKSKVSEFKIGEINIKHESFDHPVRIISGSNRKKQQDAMFPFLFGSNFDDDDPDSKALKELMMSGTNLPSDTETDDPVDLEAQLVSLPNGEEGTKASSQVANRAPSWFEELIQDADHGEEAAKALSDVASFHSSSTRVVSDEHEDAKRKRVAEENRKGLDSTDRRSLVLFLKEQDKVPLPQDPIHRIDRIAGRYSKEDLVRPLQRLYGKIPDKWKFGSSLRRASKGDASAGNTLDAKLNKEAMGQNALPELVVSTRRPSL